MYSIENVSHFILFSCAYAVIGTLSDDRLPKVYNGHTDTIWLSLKKIS